MAPNGGTLRQRETLAVFGTHPPGTPLTTSEVTEELEVGRRTTYNRLQGLVEAGHIETKSVGSKGRVWWRPPGPTIENVTHELDELFSRIDQAFIAVDNAWQITYLNTLAAETLGRSRDEIEGEIVWDVLPPVVDDRVREIAEASFTDQKNATFDYYSDQLDQWFDVQLYPAEAGMSVYFQDVTESRRRQQDLEEYETILETIDDGVYVVDDDGRFEMVNDAYAEMLGLRPDELVGMDAATFVDRETARRARELNQLLRDGEQDTARLEAAVIRADGSTFRGEATFSTFERSDGTSCRISVVRDVTERARREGELERHQGQLAALNDLNRVVQEITGAVIEQSTQAAVERVACETLADTDSYLFAWIGGIDTEEQTVHVREESGVEGYLDDITISVDPTDARSRGPTGRAVIEREIQVSNDVSRDAEYEPWVEHAEAHDYRSSAAAPIYHGDTIYGVLNVYANRQHAFTAQETALLAHLGEVIGHRIAAIERKRALLGDEVVELEFQIEGMVGPDDQPGPFGRLTIDRTVPTGDGTYLTYGVVSREMKHVLDGFVDDHPHWRDVDYREETPDGVRYEAQLVDPPVISTVTELGGYVDSAVFEDGDYFLKIHLTPSAETSRVIDVVTDYYSGAKLVTRRQRSRTNRSTTRIPAVLEEALTERQRTVLETAFAAGYFESPRTRSGETVAASLGITATTFHQHLRKAQQRIFQVLLEAQSFENDPDGRTIGR